MHRRRLTAEEAREYLLSGGTDAIEVPGLLDLSGQEIVSLPAGLKCYELNASQSSLTHLPDDIEVECRIVLDNCERLESLPENLQTGALSLATCNALHALPEGLATWFLDLRQCQRFHEWPKTANVHSGMVSLRNCINVQSLPSWMGTLATLDLAGCMMLTEIPDGIRVSGWVDIGGTGITRMPPSLKDAPLHWRGVPVSERIAFRPETLTTSEVLSETNAEVRRVMIERMGYLRFVTEAGATVLDKDGDQGGERQLLKIELEQDEDLVGLSCFCPSTGRQYFLRVPPQTVTCHQAAAWLAGFDDPDKYNPTIET